MELTVLQNHVQPSKMVHTRNFEMNCLTCEENSHDTCRWLCDSVMYLIMIFLNSKYSSTVILPVTTTGDTRLHCDILQMSGATNDKN
jgi:hypothetical protein